MENHHMFGMSDPATVAAELTAVGEELAKTSAKIESVELALNGHGAYLGITDKHKLVTQLEVLQTKEAQLQRKELFIMGALSAASTPPASLATLPTVGASSLPSGRFPATVSAVSAVAAAAAAAMASPHGCCHQIQQHQQYHHHHHQQQQLQQQLQHHPQHQQLLHQYQQPQLFQQGKGQQQQQQQQKLQHQDQHVQQQQQQQQQQQGSIQHQPQELQQQDQPQQQQQQHELLSQQQQQQQAMLATDAGAGLSLISISSVKADSAPEIIEISEGVTPAPPPSSLPQPPPSVGTPSLRDEHQTSSAAAGGALDRGVIDGSDGGNPASTSSSISSNEARLESKMASLPAPPAVSVGFVGADTSNSLGLSVGVVSGGGFGGGIGVGVGGEGRGGVLEHGLITGGSGQQVVGLGQAAVGAMPGVEGVEEEVDVGVVKQLTVTPVKKRGTRTGKDPTTSSKKRQRVNDHCKYPGCTTARTFGREGAKEASFCAVHKEKGMVNIKGRRCNQPECPHRPGFAIPGEKRGQYCATHRLPGMIDVVSRKCQVEGGGCNRQPVYGWPGERATRCGTHKLQRTLTELATGNAEVEKMHDVRGKRCQAEDCIRQPGFGDPVKDKGSVRCNEHKLPGMTNVRKRRAMERLTKVTNLNAPYPQQHRNHSQAEILHSQRQAQQAAAAAIAAAAAAAAAAQSAAQARSSAPEEGVSASPKGSPAPVAALVDYEPLQTPQVDGASLADSTAVGLTTAEATASAADSIGASLVDEPEAKDCVVGDGCSTNGVGAGGGSNGELEHPPQSVMPAQSAERQQPQPQKHQDGAPKRVELEGDESVEHQPRQELDVGSEYLDQKGGGNGQFYDGITGVPTCPLGGRPEEQGSGHHEGATGTGTGTGESTEEETTHEVLAQVAHINSQ